MGKNWKANVAAVPPLANFRLGEASGDPVDDTGTYDTATYDNDPELAQPGAIADDDDTSVRFSAAAANRVKFHKHSDVATNRRMGWIPVGQAYSAFAWVKYEGPKEVNNISYGIAGSYRASTVQGWWLYITNGILALRAGDSFDTFLVYKDESATIWDDGWHWVGYTKEANADEDLCDPTDITLYLDGQPLSAPTITGTSLTQPAEFTGTGWAGYMGARLVHKNPDFYDAGWEGCLDDVTMFEVELTAQQISDLYDDATEEDEVVVVVPEDTADPNDGGASFRPSRYDPLLTRRSTRRPFLGAVTRRRR